VIFCHVAVLTFSWTLKDRGGIRHHIGQVDGNKRLGTPTLVADPVELKRRPQPHTPRRTYESKQRVASACMLWRYNPPTTYRAHLAETYGSWPAYDSAGYVRFHAEPLRTQTLVIMSIAGNCPSPAMVQGVRLNYTTNGTRSALRKEALQNPSKGTALLNC